MSRMHQMPQPVDAGRAEARLAVLRLAKLASGGAVAKRVEAETVRLLSDWKREDLSRLDLRERLEELQSDVDSGVLAAEDYVGEAEEDSDLRAAQAQHAALLAMRRAVARELSAMAVLL